MSAGQMFSISALVVSAFLAVEGRAFGQDAALPPGVKAVWDMSKAHRDTTSTRERICINGLWRWQPAKADATAIPAADWGFFKVPGSWPGHLEGDTQTLFANPAWKNVNTRDVTEAWYQRTIAIPADWAGRRITLSADCLNSYAAVYLDGKKAGELRYPGGELALTALCKPGATPTLSMLVIALPLHTIMFSHSDTFGNKQVQGHVDRCGLCGDVWLDSMPAGPRISDFMLDTSVRKWEITFDTGLAALVPETQYTLKAKVTAPGLPDHEFASKPFTAADLKDGRFSFSSPWHAERLWDANTPENMYDVSLALYGADANPLDVAQTQRFGFREFWINGRDFYLNGSRIYLFACPIENALNGAAWATYDSARETMRRMKSFGTNFVYGHNYGCAPGSHLSYAEALRAADDAGMLVALPLPHFLDYDWKPPDADQTNGYAQHAEYYIRNVAGNHPSVVSYATSHNACATDESKNPDMIGGIVDMRKQEKESPNWPDTYAAHALRAQAIVQRFDNTRVIYHHGCSDLGEASAINFYLNFTPIQEIDDWFETWSAKGTIPVFLAEDGSPLAWDFAMYRGWYRGARAWGNEAVPYELCSAQWNAQFTGDAAMRITRQEGQLLRWESKAFRVREGWYRWDYPFEFELLDAVRPVIGEYIADNWRAWRTSGLSANTCWNFDSCWTLRDGADKSRKDLKADWENIQRPGFSPDYIGRGSEMAMDTAFPQSDWAPTAAAEALYRNNMPLLAYIAGKPESCTSKDHNFVPGEAVAKQVIVINNSRALATFDCTWSPGLPGVQGGVAKGAVETGQQQRIPVNFAIPADAAPGHYKLTATVKFGTGASQDDTFQIDVMRQPQFPSVNDKIALFDPKGETGKLLEAMKVPCQAVDAKADLGGYDILVIGKGALTVDGAAPDITRVRDGLRVIVFEQTSDALEKRLGFRTEEYGLRRVFQRVPDSPLLAGLDTDSLRDWRGSATLLPPRITFPYRNHYNGDGEVKWCGVLVAHGFRCGCLGNVASVLIEKPACGDFMPIVDGGFSLQYSPLTVYREGKGMVMFCQMDVTGRTENDPAAETLVGNIFRYVSSWKATPTDRKAIYAGDPAGARHLEHSGVVPGSLGAAKLSPDDVLVVGTGADKALAADAQAIGAFIKGGGRVLALGLDQEEAQSLLPAMQVRDDEHISTFFKPFGEDSLLAGIGPADVFDAGAEHPPLVTGGADVIGDGVLAKAHGANVVFFQLPPYAVTRAEGALQAITVDSGGALPGLKHSALVVTGTCTERGIVLEQFIRTTPLSVSESVPDKTVWMPQVGKTYTFAVLVKGESGPVAVSLGVQHAGGDYHMALEGPSTVVPSGEWTEVHGMVKCDRTYPQGWQVLLNCAQEAACLRVGMFRFYEGDYVPWTVQAEGAAAQNLIQNPTFDAGMRRYSTHTGEQYNLRRTYRRASYVMMRALANLGVAWPTPLLGRFASPALDKAEERWTSGLYADQVEAWDDPYRSYNW